MQVMASGDEKRDELDSGSRDHFTAWSQLRGSVLPDSAIVPHLALADCLDLYVEELLLVTRGPSNAAARERYFDLMAGLAAAGIETATLTLHVGAGTFLPVKSDTVEGHVMHAERGVLTAEAAARINAARAAGGRIVAVGTTSLRLLESAAGEGGIVHPFTGSTAIFITPGHRFRAVDLLVTNFHLPRSTLFMLVCAFAGTDEMKHAYAHAIDSGYRFYSYGDTSLLHRQDDHV